jgi:hypothetical protein
VRLEGAGIVVRRKLPPPASVRVYELTEWGSELKPVLLSLGRFGSRSPLPPEPPALGVDAMAAALMTTFDPAVAAGVQADYRLSLGEHEFRLRISDVELELSRGVLGAPAVDLATDPGTLAPLLWHGFAIADAVADAIAAGSLRIEGSRREVSRLLKMFRAPTPAA